MDVISPMGQGGLYLLAFVKGLIIFALMLRFLLRATHTDWRHPIVKFTATVTNPLCAPLNKLLPARGRWDWAAIATAMIIYILYALLIGYLTNQSYGAGFLLLASISEILNQLLDMLFWLILIQVILSWVSQGYNPNTAIFDQLTQPILAPFRRFIPLIGGMDLSPLAAILAIKLLQIIAIGSLTQIAQSMIG